MKLRFRNLFRRRIPVAGLHPRAAEILREVGEQGLFALPAYYSAEQVRILREEIDRWFALRPDTLKVDAQGADRRLFGIEKLSQPVREIFYDDPLMHGLGAAYMGSRAEIGYVLAGRIDAAADNLGSGGGWHRDRSGKPQYKALLYLSDVDETRGPFQYLLRSHRREAVKAAQALFGARQKGTRYSDAQIAEFEAAFGDRYPRHTALGPAGTVLFVDTRGLHRGAPIQSGRRYALTRYTWYGEPMPPHMAALVDWQKAAPA